MCSLFLRDARVSIQTRGLKLSMAMATAMPTALTILNSSMAKATQKAGFIPKLMSDPELENTELAARRWISGKQTRHQLFTQFTSASSRSKPVVKELSAVRLTKMSGRCVTKKAASSTPIVLEILIFSDQS